MAENREAQVPSQQEEIRLILDCVLEPSLVNHVFDLLYSRVLVVAGKVEENAQGSHLATLARLKLCIAFCPTTVRRCSRDANTNTYARRER